jgi:hypothetical protein
VAHNHRRTVAAAAAAVGAEAAIRQKIVGQMLKGTLAEEMSKA